MFKYDMIVNATLDAAAVLSIIHLLFIKYTQKWSLMILREKEHV